LFWKDKTRLASLPERKLQRLSSHDAEGLCEV
jgi:hypothetical protein